MDTPTKNLLKHSLKLFKGATPQKKAEMHTHVKNELKRHENALKLTGMGLQETHVQAGKIFLRIYKNQKF